MAAMCFVAPMVRNCWEENSFLGQVSEAELLRSDSLLDATAKATGLKGYCFYLIPWEEVLSMRVSAENIRQVGAEEMAASILTDMTDSGFSLAEAEEHIKTIAKLLDIAKYDSADEALEDLIARMSNRAPTEEELLAQEREKALAVQRNYQLLKEYADLWS